MVHVLARDERSAAYMADAYARVSGRVGVCEGPSGGGATYLAPGLVEANESSVPVLAFSSDVPVSSRGRYPLTELRQDALYAPLTKWNGSIDLVSKIGDQVRSAFRAICTGRPGSAHLCLPYDVLKAKHDGEGLWAQTEHSSAPAWRCAPALEATRQAATKLIAAKQVVIICGGGVISSGACEALSKLAHQLDAPVCTTVSGKGCISDNDPLSVGVVGSNGGVLATREIVAAADLVFFIACRTGSTTTEHWRFPKLGTEIIHLDVDPAVISSSYPTSIALVGDAKLGLEALIEAVQEQRQKTMTEQRQKATSEQRHTEHLEGSGLAMVAKARASKWKAFEALAQSEELPIRPERIIDQLRQALPDDAIVCADPGTPCPYVAAYFKLPKAGRYFVTNRAHGALGYALPAAIGAWYAKPQQRCVALMGDGSFGFVAGELETVARCGAPILMIVLSNDAFGWIKASQRASYGKRYFSVDFRPTDHAAIARAYGIDAYRVEDPHKLGPCLREALALNRPVLIDIRTQALEEAAAPVSQWMG
jgi:acetolactate synthase-1/2/3 large subunit